MRPDKESHRNGIVLLILTVEEVFVHVAKFRAHRTKSLFAPKLFAPKSQYCKAE